MFNKILDMSNTIIWIVLNLTIIADVFYGNLGGAFGTVLVGIMYMLYDISNTLRNISNKQLENFDI